MKKKLIFIDDVAEIFQLELALSCAEYNGWHTEVFASQPHLEDASSAANAHRTCSAVHLLQHDPASGKLDREIDALIRSNPEAVIQIITPPMNPSSIRKNHQYPRFADSYSLCRALHNSGISSFEFFYSNSIIKKNLTHFLDDFSALGKNKRCFIVGNGPSLNKIDMSMLANEVTFGCNRGYLGSKEWGHEFDFWFVGDRVQVEDHLKEWEDNIPNDTVKLIPFEYCPILQMDNLCPVNLCFDAKLLPGVGDTPEIQYIGFNSANILVQFAIAMGFREIIMVGVDQRYIIEKEQELENGRWVDMKSSNHFHPDYCESGKREFVPPRPEKSEDAFRFLANWCIEHNIRVLNASPGSALDLFPMVEFNDLFPEECYLNSEINEHISVGDATC